MSVVIETTLGDITIDLYIDERPKACLNFLKLCKVKYYNFNLFHTVNQGFIAQTGDPTGSRIGGESIWGVMEGPLKRYFEAENTPRIKHTTTGLVSFVGDKDSMIGSQFFFTLAPDLMYLDSQHCVFAEVTEGFEILKLLNEAICDSDHRPYQDIRITHTVVLEDPFPDPEKIVIPDASPEPTAERLQGGRIAPDEEIDETEGKTVQEVKEIIAEKEAKARATILEMIGDIPDAEMAPPENVLFVCKLNPVTNDDDLEIIFSRFGKIKSCEVIRDKKSGDSLQYAFVEFTEQKSCEDAYFKMDNVLIDDRRIHVDFSQSVAKVKWHGKGRGVTHYNDKGEKQDDPKNDVGNGKYKKRESPKRNIEKRENRPRSRERYNNGNYRNRNNEHRYPYRDDRYKQNRYQNYRQDNRRPGNTSRFRGNNTFRPQTQYFDYGRPKYEDRRNDRYRQVEEYRRKERVSRSRSRENNRSRQRNQSPEHRRKYRSRSRENFKSRNRNSSPEEKLQKTKKYESSDDEPKKKNKKKKHVSDNSSDESPKKSKKSKKKKSKKKRQSSSESDSDSDSESEREQKKSKKKKKKSKNYESSSESDSSESDVPKKKKNKK